ncbi:MAG: response regulator [Balneolales bacterium]
MKHILVTEDEYIISSSIKYHCELLGYKVTIDCTKDEDIIEAVRTGQYGLILMKVYRSNNLDGIELMEKIRTFSSIPVIYLTGETQSSLQKRIEKTYPADFLSKPFDYSELGEVIQRYI